MVMKSAAFLLSALLLAAGVTAARAKPTVTIAAAANLVHTLDALNAEFARAEPGIALNVTTGASGSLFAQIKNGAPFDVFLSADTEYPRAVVAAGLGDASTSRTFATGRLVLWTRRTDLDLSDLRAALHSPAANKIAIAQPKSAPYGRAAQFVLEKLGLWRELQSRIVYGENIAQTAQFVETGNADLGFVALSLVRSPKLSDRGRWQEIMPELYHEVSLDHALVLTTRGAANAAARRYLTFLSSADAKRILRQFGYAVPE